MTEKAAPAVGFAPPFTDVIASFGAPATIESEPKFVELLTTPAIVAVPPVRTMFPEEGSATEPSVGRAWMPAIVS